MRFATVAIFISTHGCLCLMRLIRHSNHLGLKSDILPNWALGIITGIPISARTQLFRTERFLWFAHSVPAYSKPRADDFPLVLFAPNKFSLTGYSADMKTWEGFATCQGKLNQGKGELPASLKAQVSEKTKGKSH